MRKFTFKRVGRFSAIGTVLWVGNLTLKAQSTAGAAAINEAADELKSFYDPIKKFIWIIAAVLGLVGVVKLYSKIQGNDPEASKYASAFLFAAIALVAAEAFIRKMFLE